MDETDYVERMADELKERGLLDNKIRLVKIEEDDICWTLSEAWKRHRWGLFRWWPPIRGSFGYPGFDFSGRQNRAWLWLSFLMLPLMVSLVYVAEAMYNGVFGIGVGVIALVVAVCPLVFFLWLFDSVGKEMSEEVCGEI